MFVPSHAGDRARRWAEVEAELAHWAGIINAAHGHVVALVGQAIEEGLWQGTGIHSPSHWLAWQAGLAPAKARSVVRLAERRQELPTAIAALEGGELSLDQAATIAELAPTSHEEIITDFARKATVPQLRSTLRAYAYGEGVKGDPRPKADAPKEGLSMGDDEHGWWLRARLSPEDGALVRQAIESARDDLFREQAASTVNDEVCPPVPLAQGLVAVAERALRSAESDHPTSDRYLVHLHLDADRPAALHLGTALPDAVRRLLTCDARLRPVIIKGGVPVSVGRTMRTVPGRIRRLIERRDGGCAVPGCHRKRGLEIHHIVHWEDGGPTDTGNLLTLCRAHHKAHHQGILRIRGDADVPQGIEFRDRFNRVLPPSGIPTRPGPDTAFPPGSYQRPLGEPLDRKWVDFGDGSPQNSEPED